MIREEIGGKRIGSGGKITQDLHGYDMSNQDLNRIWRSTMAVGTLVPCFKELGKEGDVFKIKINELVRTLPTIGPLFGSFKLQLEMYVCPIRLYNGALHNNALNIGMKMNSIKFPKASYTRLYTSKEKEALYKRELPKHIWSQSCLNAYLGLRDLGIPDSTSISSGAMMNRAVNSILQLAYYDIFKNYHANKQEENAYIITGAKPDINKMPVNPNLFVYRRPFMNIYNTLQSGVQYYVRINQTQIEGADMLENATVRVDYKKDNQSYITQGILGKLFIENEEGFYYPLTLDVEETGNAQDVNILEIPKETTIMKLKEFPLENIDKCRNQILSITDGSVPYISQNFNKTDNLIDYLPYVANVSCISETTSGQIKYPSGQWLNEFSQNGLVVKTYLSDIFNNWIKTDWITGENGIANITAVSTEGGKFTMDSLLLAQKTYNMLNRIAISGGTYDDWRRVTTGRESITRPESPIYVGGASAEIIFSEVVSNAEYDNAAGDNMPLGTLAGKGTLGNIKGGDISFTIEEPSVVLGIVSITPRIDYSQGNSWINTELQTLDDIHKPAFDGIGYQDLLTEQMDWRTIKMNRNEPIKKSIGKTVAWINYMTSINETFGDFAEDGKQDWMVLNRNYETIGSVTGDTTLLDGTTYIDPRKFNYAFADQSLTSQNFWVQLAFDVEARRIMSSKQIPNL